MDQPGHDRSSTVTMSGLQGEHEIPRGIAAAIGKVPDGLAKLAADCTGSALKGDWFGLVACVRHAHAADQSAFQSAFRELLEAAAHHMGEPVVWGDDGTVSIGGKSFGPDGEVMPEPESESEGEDVEAEGEGDQAAGGEAPITEDIINQEIIRISKIQSAVEVDIEMGKLAARAKKIGVRIETLRNRLEKLLQGLKDKANEAGVEEAKARARERAKAAEHLHEGKPQRNAQGGLYIDRSNSPDPSKPDYVTHMGGLSELSEKWVFVGPENAAVNVGSLFEQDGTPHVPIGKEALVTLFEGERYQAFIHVNGKEKPINPAILWIRGDKLETFDKPIHDAAIPPGFCDGTLNLCVMPSEEDPSVDDDDVQPFIQLLDHLIPDEEQRRWVLEWIAHKWQHPAERGPLLVLETPTEGTGRGVLEAMLRSVWGFRNVQPISRADLLGTGSQAQYNDWMMRQLVIVPETANPKGEGGTTNNAVMINHMNAMVDPAPQMRTVAEKYGMKVAVMTYFNMLVFINHAGSLPTEKESRRYAHAKCTRTKLNPPKGKAWAAWARRNGPKLRGWLRKVEITHYVHNAEPPLYMRAALINSAADARSIVAEAIEDEIDQYRDSLRTAVCYPGTSNVVPLGPDGQPVMTNPPAEVWFTEAAIVDWAKARFSDWKPDIVERQVRAWSRNQTAAYEGGAESKAWRSRKEGGSRAVRPRLWPRTAAQDPEQPSSEVIARCDDADAFFQKAAKTLKGNQPNPSPYSRY